MVMATGIVAVALDLAGFTWATRVLLTVTAALWAVMAVAFALRLRGGRDKRRAEECKPVTLTSIAGSGVLGVGLLLFRHEAAAEGLLALMAVAWLLLLPQVVRHLQRRLPGAAYLVTVATQSLVVLASTLAKQLPARWLVWPAAVLLALGLVLYLFVLGRFDFGQVRDGAGDHWVLAGALSISALACGKLAAAAGPPVPRPLEALMLLVLAVALAWYVLLAWAEIRTPRTGYDGRRWSTVFPLGMTAAAAMTAGTVSGLHWLDVLGHVLLWPAVAAWAVVAVGAVRHAAAPRAPG
ncbi:tellurite resistance/C4-dicarboxylate transporter family protein [Actinomadura violacea]|uniref:Tellurite resistance/C4-dicarboxylate transporter family protein n=1 Tax=Actinomadura violacea TaxID=2819934 RepID=A0ABS3S2P3_9ACTN|nr:tellurite resistance/C4-dicarboxylate transporter family protein [Actinomadura violacea]MBO2463176.1 tellurite resistance/C4-dicarboxylate transporter family protein [Actinomadura violacea]